MNADAVGVIVAVVVQTLMLGVWGGKVHQMLKSHDGEILSLRASRHEHANTIQEHEGRLGAIEREMDR